MKEEKLMAHDPLADADAILSVGPGRTGGFVRLDFDAAGTPRGPAVAPLAATGFAFADRELDLGLGPLAPARSVA